MTDFHVDVIRIGNINKLPNSDTLSITYVGAYPVIVKSGEYESGDLAVYIPVDSVVDISDHRFNWLVKPRIKAKKIRGTFSQGLLIHAEPGMVVGEDVADKLGITKYLTKEEQNEITRQNTDSKSTKKSQGCPSYLPRYTDIENLRRHPNTFAPGQPVIVTEKLEGESAAYCYTYPTFWQKIKSWFGVKTPGPVLCRSRNQIKYTGKWFDIIYKYDLKSAFENLDDPEGYAIYGESFGYTAGFDYNTDKQGEFLVFDVYDRVMDRWLDFDDAHQVCSAMGLDMVPVLYRGPYNAELLANMAEQDSVIGNHMSEGLIIRSEYEQIGPSKGRNIVKLKSQRYLLRKETD